MSYDQLAVWTLPTRIEQVGHIYQPKTSKYSNNQFPPAKYVCLLQ